MDKETCRNPLFVVPQIVAELAAQTSAFRFQNHYSGPVSPPLFNPNKTLGWATPWFLPDSPHSPLKPSVLHSSLPVLKVLLVWFVHWLQAPLWRWPVAWVTDCVPPCWMVTSAVVDFYLLHLASLMLWTVGEQGWTPLCIPSRIQNKALHQREEMVIELSWDSCGRTERYRQAFSSKSAFSSLCVVGPKFIEGSRSC